MPANSKAVYLRYSALSANDWPCLGVAAFLREGNGRCKELRLALGGVAATPLLISGLEFANDQLLDTGLIDQGFWLRWMSRFRRSSDLRGSEWYKRRMARLFTQKGDRAVERIDPWQISQWSDNRFIAKTPTRK